MIDYMIGLFAANAIPHFVIGVSGIRFLSLFGYSGKANIAYALFNTVMSLGLYLYTYGTEALAEHGMYLGTLSILFSYFAIMHILHRRWHLDHLNAGVKTSG